MGRAPSAVHQVCRGVGHAPAAARGAEATPLARKGDEAIEPALVAVEPQETVGEDPALEVRAELPLDEAGHGPIAFSGAREEGLELLANDGVQHGLFGAAWFVAACGRRREESGERGVGGELGSHARWRCESRAGPWGALVRARWLAG